MGIEEAKMTEFKLPPMLCELNYLSKSDGSAILSQGDTVVLASVNGPLDIKMTSQSIEKATLEVLFCSKGGKPTIADRYKENVIRQTVETAVLGCLYPRTGITVAVQELEDYGGFLACCVNCVNLALLNSGVAMRQVVAATWCCIDETGEIVMSPSNTQLGNSSASLYFVFDSRYKNLVTEFTEGSFSKDTYKEAIERCREASETIFGFYRDIVSKYSKVIG